MERAHSVLMSEERPVSAPHERAPCDADLHAWALQRAEAIRSGRLDALLAEAPTLSARLPALSEEAFRQGRIAALNETGLDGADIPEANPSSHDEAMSRPVAWPAP